jgi:hypothetical protein
MVSLQKNVIHSSVNYPNVRRVHAVALPSGTRSAACCPVSRRRLGTGAREAAGRRLTGVETAARQRLTGQAHSSAILELKFTSKEISSK